MAPAGGWQQPSSEDGGFQLPDAGDNVGIEKHFKAHRRETRFDPGRRFGCLRGMTATRRHNPCVSWFDPMFDTYKMTVDRPECAEGVLLSALDTDAGEQPELRTSRPVKRGLAVDLCEELERLCVVSSIRRHPDCPDFAVRAFELPVVGVRGGTATVRREAAQLWSVPARPAPDVAPKPFVTLATGPPQEVVGSTLLRRARLTWSGCAHLAARGPDAGGRHGVRPRNAAVRYLTSEQLRGSSMHLDCWIQDGPESYLEVDLGADCAVTHVSTAGRFPRVDTYPTAKLLAQWGAEGSSGAGLGRGRAWPVAAPEAWCWEQWVTRYELQARLEGGRAWTPIETLRGNADMTTEVAHDLREVCHASEGLKCRYLRFIPRGSHGKPALRVGVYGTCLGAPAGRQDSQAEDARVRYRVPFPLPGRNRRRTQREFKSGRNHSPEYYGKYGADYEISTRRKLRAREAREAGEEAMGLRGGRPPPRGRSGTHDSGSVSGEEAAPPGGPRLPSGRTIDDWVREAIAARPALRRTRGRTRAGEVRSPRSGSGNLLAEFTVVPAESVSGSWVLL